MNAPNARAMQVVEPSSGQRVFCVHKHHARRLHYDVRLEVAGALMSLAVPKGPSYDPSVKRLAIETGDHAMIYADFEARNPGGPGDFLLWDMGTYETVPPGEEGTMRAAGHLHVRFFGRKLLGRWHFVKTHWTAGKGRAEYRFVPGEKEAKVQWLMWKAADEKADSSRDIVSERPESVKTGEL